jgi:hypothetical protein
MRKLKELKTIAPLLLIISACFLLAYALSFFVPFRQIFTPILGGIYSQEYTMVYSFYGGSAQSAKCTQYSKNSLEEPNAIMLDNPQNLELVGDAKVRVYLLVTCGDAVGRSWRIKVNNYTVYEGKECFDEWSYLDLSFPSSYLHQKNNGVSLECDPTSSGTFYIGLGKMSDGSIEFFKTTYSLKAK